MAPIPNQSITIKSCRSVDLSSLGLRSTARTFALEIKDESMVNRHILPGDVLVFENGITPRQQDVVAVLAYNESLIRTYSLERGRPWLSTAHPELVQRLPAENALIQGVMTRLIRRSPGFS